MKKLYKSKVLENLYRFPITEEGLARYPNGKGLIRNPGDMFLLWKVVNYFNPKSLLEIGFYGGQSMGLCLEAGDFERIVSVDIDYKRNRVFNELFSDTSIEFRTQDSKTLVFDKDEKFDLIIIDGDHSYEAVNADFLNTFNLLHNNSILYMDEYSLCPGVAQTVEENLLGQRNWVPFLAGPQGMFFHHVSHSAADFLDYELQDSADKFLQFTNDTNWNGFNVLFCESPLVYTDNIHLMIDVLKFYDI